MNKFWDKVEKCEHINLDPNYCEFISCETPYCSGYETYCLDCGVYITQCGCGFNNGMSDRLEKRWKNDRKRIN